jgi:hypothetical protein
VALAGERATVADDRNRLVILFFIPSHKVHLPPVLSDWYQPAIQMPRQPTAVLQNRDTSNAHQGWYRVPGHV